MSKSKLASSVVLLSACLIFPLIARGAGSAAATVTINATVDTFAEWDVPAGYAIDKDADWDVVGANRHITATAQVHVASKALTLYANVTTTITPTATDGKAGTLTHAGGDVLDTQYKITGDVTAVDGAYITAAALLAKTYTITQVSKDGSYALNFGVQMTSPANRAPDSGNYSCQVIMTASW